MTPNLPYILMLRVQRSRSQCDKTEAKIP